MRGLRLFRLQHPFWGLMFGVLVGCSGPNETDDNGTDDTDTDPLPVSCADTDYNDCIYPSKGYTVQEYTGFEFSHADLPRTMASTFRFPTGASGKVPVIIISHGGTLNDSGHNKMETWGHLLAEHGYLVIHVAHSTFPIEAVPQLCTAFSVPMEECELPTVNPPVALKPMDAKVVIDTLPTLDTWFENNTDIELDIERIGLLGWSGGSQVPTAVAGAQRYLSPSVAITLGDERMGAGVVLSPQGPDFSGYYADESGTSMDTVTRPLLIATGDNDWKEVDNPTLLPEIRRQTYENLPTFDGHHRLLYSNLPIGTGGHGTYDLAHFESEDPDLVRISLALMSTVRAHFDTHLKDSETGQAYLDSDDPLELAGRDKAEWDAR